MPNPQNPELRRSEENIRPRLELGPEPTDVGGEGGPVPPDNQPGHHPTQEQDKPPADKFAEALGIKPDTESSDEAGASGRAAAGPGRSKGRAAKKAPSRRATATRAASTPAAAPRRGRTSKVAAKPAAETPVQPAAAAGTSGADSSAARRDEPAQQAAEMHHHKLPDDQLPHDTGMVTPAGAPVTSRAFTWPLRYCGAVLKTGGGAISAYGDAVRKLGERIMPGGR